MPVLTRLAALGTLSRSAGEGGWVGEGTGIRPYALLCLLCLILYVPGLAAIPPLDRDEARFAQATRQMLETGDFVRIRFQDSSRNNKPAGIYWLQAAAVSVFSTPEATAIWPYRVPSLLGGMAAVMLTFACGAVDRRSRPTLAARAAPSRRNRRPLPGHSALADHGRARHRGPLSRRFARPGSAGQAGRSAGIARCAPILLRRNVAGDILAG